MTSELCYSHKEKFEIFDNTIRIILTTIIDSKVPVNSLKLILDTGAFITVCNKKRAEKNGYKIYEEKGCIISGFSEKGLICDLRIIPAAVFCGFRIDDVYIATPHNDGVTVSEVIGMNILENFNFGINLSDEEIYLSVRADFVSQKPKYRCGGISLFIEPELS